MLTPFTSLGGFNVRAVTNHFTADFRWVKFVDSAGKIIYDTIDAFIQARKASKKHPPSFPRVDWPEFEERITDLNDKDPFGSRVGDILLIMDERAGYLAINSGEELAGWHGGPSVAESLVPLMINIPGDVVDKQFLSEAVDAVRARARKDGGTGVLRNWHLSLIPFGFSRESALDGECQGTFP